MLGLGLALKVGKKLLGNAIDALFSVLKSRSTYYENAPSSKTTVKAIDTAGVLDNATILLTPTAYSNERVHSVKTYTGDELVTNGDFSDGINDWTNNASAILSTENDKLKVSISGAGSGYAQQNIIGLTIGATYKISAEGEIGTSTRLALYTPNAGFNNLYADGAISTFFTATSTTENLRLYVYDDGAYGFWDNVSVIDVSSDFDFDRASSATRINSSGLVQDMQSITDPELVLNGDFEELGDELVVNGNFNDGLNGWNNNATFPVDNLSVVNNKLELENISGSTQVFTSDSFNVTSGETYKISLDTIKESGVDDFDITLRTTALGTVVETITTTQQTGSLTYYFTSSSTQSVIFQFTLRDTIKGSVDNVSVQQVDPNDRWSLGTGWSISDGVAVSDGTNNADILQSGSVVGKTYKLTFTITENNAGRLSVYIGGLYVGHTGTGNSGDFTFYGVASDTTLIRFRSALDFDGSIDNISIKDITFSEDVDLARINYDSNGDNGHILLEPTSTNLFEYSESFNTAEWNRSSITVVDNNSQSPDGANNASLMYPSSSGDFRYLHNSTIASSSKYTISAFVKASGKNVVWMYINSSSQNGFIYYDLSDQTTQVVAGSSGTPIATIKSYANDWYKISFTTATSISLNSGSGIGVCDAKGDSAVIVNGTDGVLVWGLQLEALSYPTSYIPTLTGSTVTRATETLTGSGNSTLINSTEGVLYAEIAALADDISGFRVLGISDGGSTNRIFIGYSSNNIYANVGAATTIGSAYTPTNASNFHKVALKYENNNCKFFVDGSQIGSTTTSITIPSGMNSLQFDSGAGGSDFYGKCKALAVFDRALTDQELTDLTT